MKQLSLLHSNPVLEANLRRLNPWWEGTSQRPLPAMRRSAFEPVCRSLVEGPAPITVLRGPRQVGKSTLVGQVIDQLLRAGSDPTTILFVQFDDLPDFRKEESPILRIADWFEKERIGKTFNDLRNEGRQAYLFLDEVQNLPNWAPQLKFLVDTSAVRVMATGRSALRIEAGRDSLAGRIVTFDMGPLSLREIGLIRKFGNPPAFGASTAALRQKETWHDLRGYGRMHAAFRDAAFHEFSARGAYPIAHAFPDLSWDELARRLNETVVKRAIEHDLRMSVEKGKKRDGPLLELLFRLSCRYDGQAPGKNIFQEEVNAAMHAGVGPQRIDQYLKFLDGTLLIRLVQPLELRLKKARGAPKIVICDHALRASFLQEVIPLDAESLVLNDHLRDMAGRIAEGAVGYFLTTLPDVALAHFPERGGEPEVDFIMTIGEQRIPIEVKYRRRITREDERGLRSFVERSVYNAPFGILVTPDDDYRSDDPRIVAMPLSTFLLLR